MPHEDHVVEVELVDDRQDVLGVAVERGVSFLVVGGRVRTAGADVVEEDHAEVPLEGGRDETPHVLVAAEPVREQHGLAVGIAGDGDIVSRRDVHLSRLAE